MRPILIAIIGYIIGILWELYLKSVALFIFILILIVFSLIVMRKNLMVRRYIKVLIPFKYFMIFSVFTIFAIFYIKLMNNKYENLYSEFQSSESIFIGTIVSDKKEYNYRDAYIVKVDYAYKENLQKKVNTKVIVKLEKNKNNNLNYGDKVVFKGEYKIAEDRTNYKGYSYREYLKSKSIYGEIHTLYSNVHIIGENNINKISRFASTCKNKIIVNIKQILPDRVRDLALGVLIGYTDEMDGEMKKSFKDASLSHMLAVSGSHIAYIIIGMEFLLEKTNLGKRIIKIITIFVLIFFMFLTGFTPSVTRACIMGIVMMISGIIYTENDFICSISLSALIILLINPFIIYDAGFKLSYGGTIGIVLFQKNIKSMLKGRVKKNKPNNKSILDLKAEKIISINTIKNFILEALTVTIAAQIAIIPIIALDFNTISVTFFISNLLASFFMGIITIGGFILVFISLISIKISKVIGRLYIVPLNVFIKIVEVCANIPGSKIIIITIYTAIVLTYYMAILIGNYIYDISDKENTGFSKLVKKIMKNIKDKVNKKITKKVMIIVFLLLICICFLNNKLKNTQIYFIDVGQGDCTVIVTKNNKKILIDGGGSNAENSSYDVGESVVLPYLLDRRISSLDYVIISHFDSDHYKGLEYVLKNMNVKTVIIPKQFEESDNYMNFIKITKDKKIKVIEVIAGQKTMLDKDIEMCVLWPIEDYIKENVINNNSLVFKLYCNEFSTLFTGDIEAEAEREIVKNYERVNYRGENILKSDILKVGHHGSNTSSIQEFIELVKPKIGLIGVGRNNNFGHPNAEVIERLKELGTKVYRTDEDGEIELDLKRNIKVQKFIK